MRQELVLFSAAPAVAVEALRWTELACARAGLGASAACELSSAVIEAVNNALEHGYGLAGGEVTVTLDAHDDRVVVRVTDGGSGLPQQPPVSRPTALDDRGRGSWLMQQWCDHVEHVLGEGTQTVVLVKQRAGHSRTMNGDQP
jgi:serine/threonine-protein kinase RsbW